MSREEGRPDDLEELDDRQDVEEGGLKEWYVLHNERIIGMVVGYSLTDALAVKRTPGSVLMAPWLLKHWIRAQLAAQR